MRIADRPLTPTELDIIRKAATATVESIATDFGIRFCTDRAGVITIDDVEFARLAGLLHTHVPTLP
jgi:hypothetical protein